MGFYPTAFFYLEPPRPFYLELERTLATSKPVLIQIVGTAVALLVNYQILNGPLRRKAVIISWPTDPERTTIQALPKPVDLEIYNFIVEAWEGEILPAVMSFFGGDNDQDPYIEIRE